MKQKILSLFAFAVAAVLVSIPSAQAQVLPEDYRAVLTYLGRSGDYKEKVLKVNIPRNDLEFTISGVSVPTAFGFGGWVGMTKGEGGKDVLMGDLVLLPDEVNPVMTTLLENGLEVTALHNHFFWEKPRVYFMHIHGHGDAVTLAKELKPALDLIGKNASRNAAAPAAPTLRQAGPQSQANLDTEKIARIVGHAGETLGSVYKITLARDDLKVEDHGAIINARMGLNTWAAFAGTDADAVVAGDVAMLESEVTPVLKALRKNGLDVVAIHHHMTSVRPMIIFLHYWGRGPAEKLAAGFKRALDELGNPAAKTTATTESSRLIHAAHTEEPISWY